MNITSNWVVLIVVCLTLVAVGMLMRDYARCTERGGTLVRTVAWHACVDEKR